MMKKLFISMLAVAALTVSCSDDDTTGGDTAITVDANDFQGTFTEAGVIRLDAGLTYKLTGAVVIEDGVELEIPAGTVIEAVGGTSSYIAIAQGGLIDVQGTATNPVVMTSGLATKTAGDWGGLVLCGKAPSNKGGSVTAEVSGLTYGGTETTDSSGSIRYLRVEYAGATFNSSKEFNGVSFFGVGSGTTVDYVQVFEGNDDGFEFFGGNVTANHLVVNNPTDDAFDWTEGWQGAGSFWYADLTSGRGHRIIEADNLEADNNATPISSPTITNLTGVGNGDGTEDDGLKIRRGTKGDFDNIVLVGHNESIEIDDAATTAFFAAGSELIFTNVAITTTDALMNVDGTDFSTRADVIATYPNAVITENATATGAGSGTAVPAWAQGWTTGL
ncbi:hypothetical protein LY02_00761 [Nonlabens ulvanivorans]|uniref:Multidrug transporter n=3 Tax=Nonlabens TaxID=363408 RepID=A0ABX5EAL0_NONUL|nr:hypothetical protein LY02_00761 [Nonlabens ulvanivorans]